MEVRLGNIFGYSGGSYSGNVYDKDFLAPTLNTMQGGCKQPMIIDDTYADRDPRFYGNLSPCLRSEREGFKTIVAMRGRNPENPSDRTAGSPTEQRLEPNSQGLCNTLTSVQKDNLCMEIQKVGQISNDGSQYGTVISENGISANLVAGTHGYANSCIQTRYRIRKLTPLECWRLMDFTDEDFEKAAQVNSNTQLYKQAGNSICRNVLVAILGMMMPGKEEVYKNV